MSLAERLVRTWQGKPMKIETSELRLAAAHDYSQQHESTIESSFSFRSVLQDQVPQLPAMTPAVAPVAGDDAGERRVRLLLQELIATMIALLTGEKCRCRVDRLAALPAMSAQAAAPAGGPRRTSEWQQRVVERSKEHERSHFAAVGKVCTADGREIDFGATLDLGRDFIASDERLDGGRVEFRDPLVINYDGHAAELGDMRFEFDLDADGHDESLPMLAGGSGYLALDLNGDGCINDGRELFGACSGDGFADLRAYDGDGNGWIDDSDPVFSALGVWFPDGELKPLKETGVGAIALSSAATPFSLTDAGNGVLGRVRASGVYLNEDGSAGTLQQIDLATTPVVTTPGKLPETAK